MYSLKSLMYKKYGEEKYALACEIVSRWVRFETKDARHNSIWVNDMANATSNFELTMDVAEALRKLFGLKSTEELFK